LIAGPGPEVSERLEPIGFGPVLELLQHGQGGAAEVGISQDVSSGAPEPMPNILIINAPKNAFDDPDQDLFRGRSVDDLFFPMHMNFRFFAMQPLDTFVCYDVLKNPDIENDLVRFEAHLSKHFQESDA
jgi:putative NADPH-quinone reductase